MNSNSNASAVVVPLSGLPGLPTILARTGTAHSSSSTTTNTVMSVRTPHSPTRAGGKGRSPPRTHGYADNAQVSTHSTNTDMAASTSQHVVKLERELLATKQALAHNLLRSRTLEKTLHQYKATEQAIRNLTNKQLSAAPSSSGSGSVNTHMGLLLSSVDQSTTATTTGSSSARQHRAHSRRQQLRTHTPHHGLPPTPSSIESSNASSQSSSSVIEKIPYKLGTKTALSISNGFLERIEFLCSLRSGFGLYLLNALNAYSDDSLQEEMVQLTRTVAFDINKQTFTAIATASSRGKLSSFESEALFDCSQTVLQRLYVGNKSRRKNRPAAGTQDKKDTTTVDKDTQWQILVLLLRRKLRILYLASTLQKMHAASSTTSGVFAKQLSLSADTHAAAKAAYAPLALGAVKSHNKSRNPKNSRINHSKSLKMFSSTLSAIDDLHTHASSADDDASLANSTHTRPQSVDSIDGRTPSIADTLIHTNADTLDKDVLHTFAHAQGSSVGSSLSHTLTQSKLTQLDISNKILKTLSQISMDMAISHPANTQAQGQQYANTHRSGKHQQQRQQAVIVKPHTSAVMFARRMSCIKFESVFIALAKRELRVALQRWKRVCTHLTYEHTCNQYLRYLAGVRVYYVCAYDLQRKLAKAFHRWTHTIELLDSYEMLAAVIEVQR
jgi:hypothetical protein